MRTMIGVTVLGLAMLALPATSHAGDKYDGANCVLRADGTGYCDGNFKGFRNTPNNLSDSVGFSTGTAPWSPLQFIARLNGRDYRCFPNATVAALWPTATTFTGGFTIYFDNKGTCTALLLMNDSRFKDF